MHALWGLVKLGNRNQSIPLIEDDTIKPVPTVVGRYAYAIHFMNIDYEKKPKLLIHYSN